MSDKTARIASLADRRRDVEDNPIRRHLEAAEDLVAAAAPRRPHNVVDPFLVGLAQVHATMALAYAQVPSMQVARRVPIDDPDGGSRAD